MEQYIDRHLDNGTLSALLRGELDGQQLLEAAEHLAECPLCAELLAALAEEPSIAKEPPCGINELILLRIFGPIKSRRREFLRYCVSAVAGMAAAIAVIFALPDVQKPSVVYAAAPPQPTSVQLPEPRRSVLPAPKKETLPPVCDDGPENALQQLERQISAFFADNSAA